LQLLEDHDSVDLLASAMKLLTGDTRDVRVELTPEDPIRAKKRRPDVRSQGRRPSGSYGSSSSGGYGSRYGSKRSSTGGSSSGSSYGNRRREGGGGWEGRGDRDRSRSYSRDSRPQGGERSVRKPSHSEE